MCICKNDKYYSIAETSVIACNEIKNAAYSVSTNVTNGILTNMTNIISADVMGIMSTNSDGKAIRYEMGCYILHKVLLMIILLFVVAIICYYCIKHR